MRSVITCSIIPGRWRLGLVMLAALLASATGSAEPLLRNPDVPGLFQRVAIKPGGRLSVTAGGEGRIDVAPFDVLYVFERQTRAGQEWLRVGATLNGPTQGWLPANQGVELRHLLVLGLQKRVNRPRALFFESADAITAVALADDRTTRYTRYVAQAQDQSLPASAGVVAIEPQEIEDMSRAFALMPIVSRRELTVPGAGRVNLYETLSVPLQPEASRETAFRVGVAFVIDTTQSMGPYIEGTREAVARVYKRISATPAGRNASFALVAYRDSTKAAPGLEYVARTVHPLQPNFDAQAFDRAIAGLKPSTVSSKDFREDAIAGVRQAMTLPGWDAFQARYLILISDAGMRDGSDALSSTRLNPDAVAEAAEQRDFVVASIYLDTEAGASDRHKAVISHRTVSKWENSPSAFLQIKDGDVATFTDSLDRLADYIAANADPTAQAARARQRNPGCEAPGRLTAVDRLLCNVGDNTQALRVEWLGRLRGQAAPAVARGWVADMSLDATLSRKAYSFSPYLLLTRNQLNDLINALSSLHTVSGQDIQSNRARMVDIFRAAMARGAINTDLLQSASTAQGNAPTLSDFDSLGAFLPAYLAELPMRSKFMNLKVQDWIAAGAIRTHRDDLDSSIALFKSYLDDDLGWVKLARDADAGDMVYPVPWSRIP